MWTILGYWISEYFTLLMPDKANNKDSSVYPIIFIYYFCHRLDRYGNYLRNQQWELLEEWTCTSDIVIGNIGIGMPCTLLYPLTLIQHHQSFPTPTLWSCRTLYRSVFANLLVERHLL